MCPELLLLALSGSPIESETQLLHSTLTSPREIMILLLLTVIIGAIWITIILWDRFRRSSEAAVAASRSLFDELCVAHRLDHHDVMLLTAAAQERQIESPSSFFTRPDRFDELCIETHPNAQVYRQLRHRLFGKLA